jgi:membrane protein
MNSDRSATTHETFEDQRRREKDERMQALPHDDGRGRTAESPSDIPKAGWKDILKRSIAQIQGDHLPLISAGVAFFFLLGLFPGLAAMVSIYGWLADPVTVAGHVDEIAKVLPGEAADIIHEQIDSLASANSGAGWGAVIGVLLAIWAGSKAMKGMVEALNIAYNEKEDRGLIKKQLVYLGLTLGAVLVGIVSILLIAIVPAVVDFLPIPDGAKSALIWLRWPLLLLIGMTSIAAVYRYGPARAKPEWRWVSWGAGAATILWLLASALFSVYVTNFGNYNETYGSLGAVVVLMMWLYLTAFLILMGAEVDAEMELQTVHDTTNGEGEGDKPMGSRNAYVADNVASSP